MRAPTMSGLAVVCWRARGFAPSALGTRRSRPGAVPSVFRRPAAGLGLSHQPGAATYADGVDRAGCAQVRPRSRRSAWSTHSTGMCLASRTLICRGKTCAYSRRVVGASFINLANCSHVRSRVGFFASRAHHVTPPRESPSSPSLTSSAYTDNEVSPLPTSTGREGNLMSTLCCGN